MSIKPRPRNSTPTNKKVPKNSQTAVPPSEDKLQCECNKAEERVTMIWRCRVAGHLANVPVAWCRLAMLCYAMVFLTNRWYTTTLYCNTIYLNVLSLENKFQDILVLSSTENPPTNPTQPPKQTWTARQAVGLRACTPTLGSRGTQLSKKNY